MTSQIMSRRTSQRTSRSKVFPVILLALTLPLQANAQSNTPSLEPSFQVVDPCKVSVVKFEETIAFIRNSQGVKAAAELKEKLLPAKLANDILFKDGYCGLANYLREKKLTR